MKFIVIALACLLTVQIFPKIRILTFHCNQADFIEMQYKCLSRFLLDDFELIVFNDAKTKENEKWIETVCWENGIQCVRFQPEWHSTAPLNFYLKRLLAEPDTIGHWGWNASTSIEELSKHASVRHSHVIQYALDNYGYDHDDIVVLMDGDNFLIAPLSIRELLGSYDIIGFNQVSDAGGAQRKRKEKAVSPGKEMLWVVFIAFNPSKIPNPEELQFHVDVVKDHWYCPHNGIGDTGASVYKYLKNHPGLKIQAYLWQDAYTLRSFTREEIQSLKISERLMQLVYDIYPGSMQFFLFENFVHFSSGSFEANDPNGHRHKVDHLRKFINEITQAY